jgi:hypothetical protein
MSPLTAVGLVPLLFQPDLWKDKTLGFLLMTAVFSIAVALSSEASLTALAATRSSGYVADMAALVQSLRVRIPPKTNLFVSVSTIAILGLCGLVRTFTAAKTPLAATVEEWTIIHKFSNYNDFSLWFTGIGSRALGHTSILGALYSVWAWIWPKAEGLFLLRLLAVAWPAIPLLLWTRRAVGATAGWFISAAYLSLPTKALLTANDAFPASFAVGFFFLCGYFFEAKRVIYGLLAAIATVAFHEQSALWVVTLGFLLATRDRSTAWGTWLSLVAVAYFVYAAYVLLPHAGVLTYVGGPPVAPGAARALSEPVASSLLNPAYAIPRWLDNQSLEFWLVLLLPLGWLPLRNSRWFAWLLPAIALSYLARHASDWRTSSYTHFAALAIVSSIVSLGRLKRSSEVSRARYVSVYAGWLAALLPCVVLLGALWLPLE